LITTHSAISQPDEDDDDDGVGIESRGSRKLGVFFAHSPAATAADDTLICSRVRAYLHGRQQSGIFQEPFLMRIELRKIESN
jgi:hypothetical protein